MHVFWQTVFFEKIIVKSWWVFLCLILFLSIYYQALDTLKQDIVVMKKQYLLLKESEKSMEKENQYLQLRLSHYEDPRWNEMVLIEKFGLVPSGKKIVIFDSSRP